MERLRAAGMLEDELNVIAAARLARDVPSSFELKGMSLGRWWQLNPVEERREGAELRRFVRKSEGEVQARARAALGDEWVDAQEPPEAGLSFLAPDKRRAVKSLREDYADLHDQFDEEARDFPLPEDNRRRALLKEQFRSDLTALLTPAELAEYDLRHSDVALALRDQVVRDFACTEAEFRALYQRLAARQAGPAREAPPAVDDRMRADLRAVLGPQRYAEWQRVQSAEYRTLAAAAQEHGLPEAAARAVFDLRAETADAAKNVADNPALSPEARRSVLADLARRARARAESLLGVDANRTVVENQGLRWLQTLESGQPIPSED